ncbi:MAG: DoxX family protein, partial [Chitinophagaceae bacterium]
MQAERKFLINQLQLIKMNWYTIGTWALRIIAALILLQTLFFKFSAAEESVYIFSTLGMEPWGRIGSGVLELIASILILYPRTTFFGAALGAGLMSGAIFFHLTKLGVVVKNDGGQLFIYAMLVFVSCVLLLIIYRKQGMETI